MKTALNKLRCLHTRFVEMLRAEEANPEGNGDKKIREQFLVGRIRGLKEAIDILEGRKTEEKQP